MKVSKSRLKILINEVMSQMAGAGDVDKGGSSGDYVSYSNNPNALKFAANYTEGLEESVSKNMIEFAKDFTELAIAFSSMKIAIPYALAKIFVVFKSSKNKSEQMDALLGLAPGKTGKVFATLSQAGVDSDAFKSIGTPITRHFASNLLQKVINDPENESVVDNIMLRIKADHPELN